MKTNRTLKSAATIAVLGIFLAACSGGGDSAETARTTTTNNTTTPTKLPTVPTPVSSGTTNIGASGNEAIDGVAADTDAILEKLNSIEGQIDETNSNAEDAKKNSSWAKWLGIGIAGAMVLQMGANGFANGKETGSVWKGLGGFFFNTRSDADRKYADDLATTKQKEYESVAGRLSARSDARAVKLAGAAAKIGGATIDRLDKFDQAQADRTKGLSTQLADQDPRAALRTMSTSLDGVKTQIEKDLRDANDAKSKAESSAASEKAKVQSLEQQVASKQIEVAQAEAARDAAIASKDATAEAKTDLAEKLGKELGQMQSQLASTRSSAAELQLQVQASQDEVVAERAKTSTALEEYASFRSELESGKGVNASFMSRVYDSSLPSNAKKDLLDLGATRIREANASGQ